MYENNKIPKHFPSFLLNNLKNDKENIKTFISPPNTVNKRKSEIPFTEFIKLNTAISNKKRISLRNIKDSIKDKKKNYFSSNNLNLKSPDALIMNLNDATFPKANILSKSIAEFSFPYIDGDIRESNARAKYLLSREIQELILISNTKDKIKEEEDKKFVFDVKSFNSIITPMKNNLEDLKKLIYGVEKDAKYKIQLEKKSLQGGVQKFLDKAETNYNIQLEKKMKEILGLLSTIREFNEDKFKTYYLIKKKIDDYSVKNMELAFKTDKLKKINKNLAKEYNDKIHYRKNLIEFINEKKNKLKITQEQNKNNSQINLECENEIHSLRNNLSKYYNPEKLDNLKFSLIKSFKELELKNTILKKNLNDNAKKNKNQIIQRIFEIINEHKQENSQNKEEFRFSTTIKSFHQDSKEKFFSAKTRFSLDKNIKFKKETHDSSVNIKSLIELFVKDEAIINKFNEFNHLKKDINPIE